jgi:hypothetical protein
MSKLELVLNEQLRDDYSAQTMEALFLRLDRLHDYASEGRLQEVSSLSRAELQGWLEELIYTARETLREIDVPRPAE